MKEKHKLTCHMNSLAHMAEGKQFALTCNGCECPVAEENPTTPVCKNKNPLEEASVDTDKLPDNIPSVSQITTEEQYPACDCGSKTGGHKMECASVPKDGWTSDPEEIRKAIANDPELSKHVLTQSPYIIPPTPPVAEEKDIMTEIREKCDECGTCVNEICLKHQKALSDSHIPTAPSEEKILEVGDHSWMKGHAEGYETGYASAMEDMEHTAPSDWEARFDEEFTIDNGPTVEASIKDPNGMAGPIKAFIRSVEHAAILRTRESVVRELAEKSSTLKRWALTEPIGMDLLTVESKNGKNKIKMREPQDYLYIKDAEFRTILNNLKQNHE